MKSDVTYIVSKDFCKSFKKAKEIVREKFGKEATVDRYTKEYLYDAHGSMLFHDVNYYFEVIYDDKDSFIQIGERDRFEDTRHVKGVGNIRVCFWFYWCPRVEINLVYKSGKMVVKKYNPKVDEYFKSKISEENWRGYTIRKTIMDDFFNKITEFLV